MVSRRKFLKAAALAGAGLFAPAGLVSAQPAPGTSLSSGHENARVYRGHVRTTREVTLPTLDPNTIPKYGSALVIPPAMPRTAHTNTSIDYYEIGVRQFSQQILPTGLPATTVWGFGSVNHPATFNYPSFTIEARYNRPVRVKWINQLVDASGNFLPHLLPIDPTIHWANPAGGLAGRDSTPTFDATPGSYTGPVPFVTHVHGAHTTDESDGYTEAWFLPDAANIPDGYARVGTFYDYFKAKAEAKYGQAWTPGSAVFQYPNDQRASTLWYHDHVLGMTRANVYAGPAGFYLLRGGPADMPAAKLLPTGAFEIGLAIQDRAFNADGSLFYPDSREYFDGYPGPYTPSTDVPPIWNPEFFGNTMLVNGRTWPVLNVQARRYRLRFLNGCNARFLILKIAATPDQNAPSALPFHQIGAEGGFLKSVATQDVILMSPAERADCIIDFTGIAPGTELYLLNLGPDGPFAGGAPGVNFPMADPNTTGQVMKFVVGQRRGLDTTLPANKLILPRYSPLGKASVTRQVSLNEMMSMSSGMDIPVMAMLGQLDAAGNGVALGWSDPITENPARNATEVWEIYNFTGDAHPIHLHEVMFEVVNRQNLLGVVRRPDVDETTAKDTVIAYPGEITRIKAKFDLEGLYVWHCHIVEHEDNEMMRPYYVGPIPGGLPF